MKRLAALFVSLLVILSCTAALAAGSAEGPRTFTEEERIAFLNAKGLEVAETVSGGFECTMCWYGAFVESRTHGHWYDDGIVRTCPFDWRKSDYRQTREITHYHTCNYCGYTYTARSAETRWICSH